MPQLPENLVLWTVAILSAILLFACVYLVCVFKHANGQIAKLKKWQAGLQALESLFDISAYDNDGIPVQIRLDRPMLSTSNWSIHVSTTQGHPDNNRRGYDITRFGLDFSDPSDPKIRFHRAPPNDLSAKDIVYHRPTFNPRQL